MDTFKENTGASVFIVNKRYEIVHFNDRLKELFPEIQKGDLCYHALCGEGCPCPECPFVVSEDKANALVYNKKIKKWIEVNTGEIECPGEGICNVVISKNIRDEKMPEPDLESGAGDERDSLTGLYRKSSFFKRIKEVLETAEHRNYCLIALDIEHFKLFNEWYSKETGDRFLKNIGLQLLETAENAHGVAGYMGEDDFAILLPDEELMIEGLQKRIMGYAGQYGGEAGFLPAFGIYEIRDESIPVNMMYDRASIAVSAVKGNYAKRICRFDSGMIQRMEANHIMLSEVQRGLLREEFVLYFQPKCNMATGKIVGSESLVRWQHPDRGLVMPGEFIPTLEQSGFVAKLDCYIWDRVCRNLRRWIDVGLNPMLVSVNVSRVDIYTIDVVEYIKSLVEQYELPLNLLEVEITESAYTEEYQLITQVAENLRSAGFTVLMDDFGSGYSSLNMLKDINVDVLKIDMKFLDMDEQSAGKGLGILEAITGMARLIGMKMIAEGVETDEHVRLLLDMGCVYGQGYYFYRPMPVGEYEKLMADRNNFDHRGIKARKLQNMSVKELLNEELFSDAVIHKILGGIGFYSISDNNIELLRVNEQYYKVTGTNPIDLEEKRQWILEEIYEEDRSKALDIFRRADQDILNGGEGDIRRYETDGSTIWIHLHVFFMKEKDGNRLYYGAVSNVTEQKRREQSLKDSQKALRTVFSVAENDETFIQLAEENRKTASTIFAQITPGGMIGGYCEEGFPLYFANAAMIELLGYDSYSEFEEGIRGKVINTIHPDDRERVAMDIGPEYYAGLEYTTKYRMPKKDGTWFWTLDRGRVVQAEDGRLAIVSACTDISETMAIQQELESILRLAKIIGWSWDMKSRCLVISNIQQSSQLTRLFGKGHFIEGGIQNFPDSILETGFIAERYKEQFRKFYEELYSSRVQEPRYCEIPITLEDGEIMWLHIACEIIVDENGIPTKAIGYYTDITEEHKRYQKRREDERTLEIFRKQALYDFVVNLTENSIQGGAGREMWFEETGCDLSMSFTDINRFFCEKLVILKYQSSFRTFVDRARMLQAHENGEIMESLDYERMYKGATRWMRLLVNYVEEGGVVYAYVFVLDIDAQKRQEQQLTRMAQTDAMTGLYNRYSAIPKIKRYLEEYQHKHLEEQSVLIMFDLDNFKAANDVFGHAYGDTMIIQNAGKLRSFFREEDIICRMGGDEFLVLCKNIREDVICGKLDKIVQDMAVSYENGEHCIRFSISAGYVMIPEQGLTFGELYKKADTALFTAKMNGKSSYKKYEPAMKKVRFELADPE